MLKLCAESPLHTVTSGAATNSPNLITKPGSNPSPTSESIVESANAGLTSCTNSFKPPDVTSDNIEFIPTMNSCETQNVTDNSHMCPNSSSQPCSQSIPNTDVLQSALSVYSSPSHFSDDRCTTSSHPTYIDANYSSVSLPIDRCTPLFSNADFRPSSCKSTVGATETLDALINSHSPIQCGNVTCAFDEPNSKHSRSSGRLDMGHTSPTNTVGSDLCKKLNLSKGSGASPSFVHHCTLCGKQYRHTTSLKNHMRKHTSGALASKRFRCPHCVYSSQYHRNVLKHMEAIHKNLDPPFSAIRETTTYDPADVNRNIPSSCVWNTCPVDGLPSNAPYGDPSRCFDPSFLLPRRPVVDLYAPYGPTLNVASQQSAVDCHFETAKLIENNPIHGHIKEPICESVSAQISECEGLGFDKTPRPKYLSNRVKDLNRNVNKFRCPIEGCSFGSQRRVYLKRHLSDSHCDKKCTVQHVFDDRRIEAPPSQKLFNDSDKTLDQCRGCYDTNGIYMHSTSFSYNQPVKRVCPGYEHPSNLLSTYSSNHVNDDSYFYSGNIPKPNRCDVYSFPCHTAETNHLNELRDPKTVNFGNSFINTSAKRIVPTLLGTHEARKSNIPVNDTNLEITDRNTTHLSTLQQHYDSDNPNANVLVFSHPVELNGICNDYPTLAETEQPNFEQHMPFGNCDNFLSNALNKCHADEIEPDLLKSATSDMTLDGMLRDSKVNFVDNKPEFLNPNKNLESASLMDTDFQKPISNLKVDKTSDVTSNPSGVTSETDAFFTDLQEILARDMLLLSSSTPKSSECSELPFKEPTLEPKSPGSNKFLGPLPSADSGHESWSSCSSCSAGPINSLWNHQEPFVQPKISSPFATQYTTGQLAPHVHTHSASNSFDHPLAEQPSREHIQNLTSDNNSDRGVLYPTSSLTNFTPRDSCTPSIIISHQPCSTKSSFDLSTEPNRFRGSYTISLPTETQMYSKDGNIICALSQSNTATSLMTQATFQHYDKPIGAYSQQRPPDFINPRFRAHSDTVCSTEMVANRMYDQTHCNYPSHLMDQYSDQIASGFKNSSFNAQSINPYTLTNNANELHSIKSKMVNYHGSMDRTGTVTPGIPTPQKHIPDYFDLQPRNVERILNAQVDSFPQTTMPNYFSGSHTVLPTMGSQHPNSVPSNPLISRAMGLNTSQRNVFHTPHGTYSPYPYSTPPDTSNAYVMDNDPKFIPHSMGVNSQYTTHKYANIRQNNGLDSSSLDRSYQLQYQLASRKVWAPSQQYASPLKNNQPNVANPSPISQLYSLSYTNEPFLPNLAYAKSQALNFVSCTTASGRGTQHNSYFPFNQRHPSQPYNLNYSTQQPRVPYPIGSYSPYPLQQSSRNSVIDNSLSEDICPMLDRSSSSSGITPSESGKLVPYQYPHASFSDVLGQWNSVDQNVPFADPDQQRSVRLEPNSNNLPGSESTSTVGTGLYNQSSESCQIFVNRSASSHADSIVSSCSSF